MREQRSEIIERLDDPNLLKPHKFSVGLYGEDSFHDLVESIKELGILQPLYATTEGVIISGHRRWRAAQTLHQQGVKVSIPVIRISYSSQLDEHQAIIEFNRQRIKTGQQLYNEGKALKEIEAERAKRRQEATQLAGRDITGQPIYKTSVVENFPQPKEGNGKTRDGIAKTIGLGSGRQWDKLEYVAKHKPELLSEIKPDGITIHKAYIKTYRDEIKRKVKKMEWPTGKYRVIYADPPWQYSNNQPDYFTTQDDHYPTMSINEICALPVSKLALDNAVLFLWVTSPILEDSFKVIDAWGFKYKASFIWDKVKHNMGHYNSIRHEFLLVAVRGSCPPDTPELYDSVQSAERTDHSAKPELFRQIIDTLYPYGPRIELFARRKAKGWEQYGNQIS